MINANKDHNELEAMDVTFDQVLDELKSEHAGVGASIAAWMEDHRGHTGTGIRWWVPAGTMAWYAHGRCNQCRVDSQQHYVGSDDPVSPGPDLGNTVPSPLPVIIVEAT